MTMKTEVKLGIYKHFKGGVYQVIENALDSETLEEVVVYKSLNDGSIWVQPAYMFLEYVARADGPRFTYLGDPNV